MEEELTSIIVDHLQLLAENLNKYFPETEWKELEQAMWVLNPFGNVKPAEPNLRQDLAELADDLIEKAAFVKGKHGEFWVRLLADGTFGELALKAVSYLVRMPSTYMSEAGFSTLVDIKTKKRNCLLDGTLDSCMRGVLEKVIKPDFDQIAAAVRQNISH